MVLLMNKEVQRMNITDLRTQTGMSQSQFADYFNIPSSTLKKWEQGQRQCPEYLLELIEYKLKNENLIK
jgi:DNA-binding transcriptional regulator YiaG